MKPSDQKLTFLNDANRDEESLRRWCVFPITENKLKPIVTFEANDFSVSVPEAVHLHILLGEILTWTQIYPSFFCLEIT